MSLLPGQKSGGKSASKTPLRTQELVCDIALGEVDKNSGSKCKKYFNIIFVSHCSVRVVHVYVSNVL